MSGAGPTPSGWRRCSEVAPGILLIEEPFVTPWFSANIFVVQGRDADLVIDTGTGMVPLLPDLPRDPGKPLIGLATHIHCDHAAALHEFAHRLGPEREAGMFAAMPDADTRAFRLREMPEPVLRAPAKGWRADRYQVRAVTLTRGLTEADMIDLGDHRLSILELPGHSPGSIGVLDTVRGIMFTGDAIYRGKIVDDLPHSDLADYRRTMRRLAAMEGVITACCGHGPILDGSEMRQIARDWLRTNGG